MPWVASMIFPWGKECGQKGLSNLANKGSKHVGHGDSSPLTSVRNLKHDLLDFVHLALPFPRLFFPRTLMSLHPRGSGQCPSSLFKLQT